MNNLLAYIKITKPKVSMQTVMAFDKVEWMYTVKNKYKPNIWTHLSNAAESLYIESPWEILSKNHSS